MNNLLSIETSGQMASISLMIDNKEVGFYQDTSRNKLLASWVDRMLNENAFSIKELDAIAVNIGPGGFTGIRSGLSLAKGLAMSCSLPIVPIPLFDAIADKYSRNFNDSFVIAMHAYGEKFFMQEYNSAFEKTEIMITDDTNLLNDKNVIAHNIKCDMEFESVFEPTSKIINEFAIGNGAVHLTENIIDIEAIYIGSNF